MPLLRSYFFAQRYFPHNLEGGRPEPGTQGQQLKPDSQELTAIALANSSSLLAHREPRKATGGFSYVCSTPTVNFGTSGFSDAASSAVTIASRVSAGSMILSIHSRAAP